MDKNKIIHLDLFSGIGGFAYAIDQVWDNAEHIFCDNDKFCQQVLKKHWPNSKIYGDIRTITNANWTGSRTPESTTNQNGQEKNKRRKKQSQPRTCRQNCFILTGGFPCQPFSQAGKRRGKEDDRHLWPEMLRVIQLTKPQFVIAENVRGILTIEGGLVFEQVCLDLEASGYEVQPFIIPAVAVNAPHRRDRVWFVANRISTGGRGDNAQFQNEGRTTSEDRSKSIQPQNREALPDNTEQGGGNAPDTECKRYNGRSKDVGADSEGLEADGEKWKLESRSANARCNKNNRDWHQNWLEVATFFCQLDDELSDWLDRCFNDVIYLKHYENTYKNKGQVLSYLQKEIQSQKIWEKIRRFVPIFKQKDLLAILRKLQKESNRQNDLSSKGKEVQGESLCHLWETEWACVPPQRREHQKQLARELADALPQLSYEVALEVTEIWNHLSLAYSSMNPLDFASWSKARHRVERLKSLGNSIVPQVAIEILKALRQ